MPTVIITVGIPASGKTTWAKEQVQQRDNIVIVSRDDIRLSQGLPFKRESENWITTLYRLQMAAYIQAGLDVICADTNLYYPFRRSLISFAHSHGAGVEIKLFPIELEEAVRRDSLRDEPVGIDVVHRFYGMWQNSDPIEEKYPLPRCGH